MQECFIRRDKSKLHFFMHEQIEKKRKTSEYKVVNKTVTSLLQNSKFVLQAIYKPKEKEFWIFNTCTPVEFLKDGDNDTYVIAKLYHDLVDKDSLHSMFVLKSRHCQECGFKTGFFCDKGTGRAWPYQSELLNFSVVSALSPSTVLVCGP